MSKNNTPENKSNQLPPGTPEAIVIEGHELNAKDIGKIIESQQRGSLPGRICATVLIVAGLILMACGLTEKIDFVVEIGDFTARLTNATPGVFAALLGIILFKISQPDITLRKQPPAPDC